MKYPYRLIMVRNGEQSESLGAFHTELQGIKAMQKLYQENKETIQFPTKFLNTEKIIDVKYNLVLIKKRDENDPTVTKLRNDYGEFVDHISNNDLWLIIDKTPYDVEEKFWVYGYHPLTDRKDFSFIYNELVYPKATNKSDFLNVKVFLNKLLLIGYNSTDLVTCKNHSDAVRLYNTIKEKCESDKKVKYVCFSGDCNSTHLARRQCIKEIMDLTNWDENKVIRCSTKTNKTWIASERKEKSEAE